MSAKVWMRCRRWSAVLIGVAALPSLPLVAQQPAHRGILVSFDGFSEQRLRQITDSAAAPALWSLFSSGACADAVRPMFPSVTPSGHAAIWTGAYGNVNGIEARQNGKLPLPTTTILETTDGFSAASLRAEPLWITAARQGRSVFGNSVTQAPGAPGYPDPNGDSGNESLARLHAEATLRNQRLNVVNAYNRQIAPARVITAAELPPHPAALWLGLDRLGAHHVEPREISWAFGADSLHALFFGERTYTSAVISATRDVTHGVVVQVAPTDSSNPRGRALARFFSPSLELAVSGGHTFIFARLFELAPDLSQFMLFISEGRVIETNHSALTAAYDSAVQGILGNGAKYLMEHGDLGPTLANGGDGRAEWRYLETLELLTRQFMRASVWGWHTFHPDLQLDYFPLPDEALHSWLGFADPSTPGIPATVRERVVHMLARAYTLVDLRLAGLRTLAAEDPQHTLLVVTGEHGMRPIWKVFRPNVLLKSAGLLTVDNTGAIDLGHTVAAAPNGFWISVNRRSRRGGIVASDSVEQVLRDVESTLRAARDESGVPIVTTIWRTGGAADSLGIGGPAGGDIYFGVAPGINLSASVSGTIIGPDRIQGEHGFPSTDQDMQPALCALGPSIAPHRIGLVRSIDAAPTLADWLGISPPADARGRSLLQDLVSAKR